jgi:hypothetical protein
MRGCFATVALDLQTVALDLLSSPKAAIFRSSLTCYPYSLRMPISFSLNFRLSLFLSLTRSVAVDLRLLDLGALLLRDAVDFKELDVTSRALKASQTTSSSSSSTTQVTPTKQQPHRNGHEALDTFSPRNINQNNSTNTNNNGGELSLLEEGESREWAKAAFAPRLARQRTQYNNSSGNKRTEGRASKFSAWLTRSGGCFCCCVSDDLSDEECDDDFNPTVPEINEGDEDNDDNTNGSIGMLVSHNGGNVRRGIAGSVDSRRIHKSRSPQFKRRGIPCLGCGRAARVAAAPLGDDGQEIARRRRRGVDGDDDDDEDEDGSHGTSAPADAVEWWGAVEQALAITALAGNSRLQSLCLSGCDFTAGRFAAGRKSQRSRNNSNGSSVGGGSNSGGAARLLGTSLRALPLLRLLDCRGAALDRAAKRTVADALLSALDTRASMRIGSVVEGSDGLKAGNKNDEINNDDNDSDSSDDSVKEAARRARRKARKAAAAQAAAISGGGEKGEGGSSNSSFDQGKRGSNSPEGLRYLAVEGWALLPGTSALDLDQRSLVDEDALLLAAALRCNTELQALR